MVENKSHIVGFRRERKNKVPNSIKEREKNSVCKKKKGKIKRDQHFSVATKRIVNFKGYAIAVANALRMMHEVIKKMYHLLNA